MKISGAGIFCPAFPPELAKAEVCSVSGTYSLDCVDADGIEVIHDVNLHKISGFFDSEPKYSRLSTIVMMRKQGFELRSSMSQTGSASSLFFVRAR